MLGSTRRDGVNRFTISAMRTRISHIFAFCIGAIVGQIVGLIALLAINIGLRNLPRALALLLRSLDKLPGRTGLEIMLFFAFFYAVGTLQPETSKLRPNERYAISGIIGVALSLLFIATVATLFHFSRWFSWMHPEVRRGLAEIAVMGVIVALPAAARRFATEIEPGLGYCHHCGYDVRLLDVSQCPECGERVIKSVSVRPILKREDLDLHKNSPLAIIYLLNPQDRLEEEAWVRFVHQMRKNSHKFPQAQLYAVDESQSWAKQWLENSSLSDKKDSFALIPSNALAHVAFVVDGVVLTGVSRSLVDYYLSHGPESLPGFKLGQEKPTRKPPAHFPNSFKKSSCIGRPSSLLSPYKH